MKYKFCLQILAWYVAFWVLAAGLHFATGWGWALPLALVVITPGLAAWAAHHGLAPGEKYCLIWRRGYRVRHLHWPRSGLPTCERVREMYEEDSNAH